MTVYVDNMRAPLNPKHAPSRRYVMSHMIADTDHELHEMADRIGVQRKWFQGDHYDITQAKRVLAIKYEAKEITWRQCSLMMANKRATGILGTPETAHEVYLKRKARK